MQCLEQIGQIRPQIIFLDYQMPVLTGLDVLEKLREHSQWRSLPVVLLSASDETQSKAEARGLTAERYIVKPFEMSEITDAIKTLVEANS